MFLIFKFCCNTFPVFFFSLSREGYREKAWVFCNLQLNSKMPQNEKLCTLYPLANQPFEKCASTKKSSSTLPAYHVPSQRSLVQKTSNKNLKIPKYAIADLHCSMLRKHVHSSDPCTLTQTQNPPWCEPFNSEVLNYSSSSPIGLKNSTTTAAAIHEPVWTLEHILFQHPWHTLLGLSCSLYMSNINMLP